MVLWRKRTGICGIITLKTWVNAMKRGNPDKNRRPDPKGHNEEDAELTVWGKKALEVWKKSRPKMYQELKKRGLLKTAAVWAQERTKEQVAAWVRAGWLPEYARQEALRIWILLPSEKEQKELSVDQMPWLDEEDYYTSDQETLSLFDDKL